MNAATLHRHLANNTNPAGAVTIDVTTLPTGPLWDLQHADLIAVSTCSTEDQVVCGIVVLKPPAETLADAIVRVKASTLTDEDPGEPDLDDEWGDWSDDDGAAEVV